ncbi:MAG: enolase-like domain-containing protein [Thermoleophilia bacterium]
METVPGRLYAAIAALPLLIEEHDFAILKQAVSSGFERVTTVVRLRGDGREGVGEDVTYEAEAHERVLPERTAFPLAGSRTLGEHAALLEELLPAETGPHARWGFESAALDLALRQAGVTLGEVMDRRPSDLRFVVSTRLGSPPDPDIVLGWLRAEPSLEFKLDPQSSWTPGMAARLAATGRVRVLDLKGFYKDSPVDQDYDPELYEMVAREFPDAFIEDPAPTDEAFTVLESARSRLTWDAAIHSVADVRNLRWRPAAVNMKPSRFGSLRRLFETIEYCLDEGIPMYGGGQFELGPGRGQIQELAALFYPDNPNDVAPRPYNQGDPRPGLPANPLVPPAVPRAGFGWSG